MEKCVAKCEFCRKEFNKVAYRNRHVKLVHMKNTDEKSKVKYNCEQCDKQYNRKYSLQCHITTVHSPETDKYFSCKKCSYKTIYNSSLKRHLLKVHQNGKDEVTKLVQPYKCTLCNAQYKYLPRLRYHERKVHDISCPPKIIKKRQCPLCTCITTGPNADQDIIKHFKVVHNIDIQIEKLHFSSIDSFYEWKKETETKTISVFIKRSSTAKAMLFRCHRCGIYKTKGSNKRRLKIKGSCKIGAFCPAMIKVKTMTDKSVEVHYISKHIGHQTELKHIHLTKEEREYIATQLASNIPRDDILKGVRSTLSNNMLKRIHLINKKDIINIEKSYNLNSESINQSICNDGLQAGDTKNNLPLIDDSEEDEDRIEYIILDELNCETENISLDDQKKKLIEEFKVIMENSIETREELKIVKNHFNQLILTLKASKLASGKSLQSVSISDHVYCTPEWVELRNTV